MEWFGTEIILVMSQLACQKLWIQMELQIFFSIFFLPNYPVFIFPFITWCKFKKSASEKILNTVVISCYLYHVNYKWTETSCLSVIMIGQVLTRIIFCIWCDINKRDTYYFIGICLLKMYIFSIQLLVLNSIIQKLGVVN